MAKKIEKITPEHEARFPEWVDKWVKIGLSTEPADFDKAEAAALKAYDLCGLKRPLVVLRVGSPYAATVAGAMAWLTLREIGKAGKEMGEALDQFIWSVVVETSAQVNPAVDARIIDKISPIVRDVQEIGGHIYGQIASDISPDVSSLVRYKFQNATSPPLAIEAADRPWLHLAAKAWEQVEKQVRGQVMNRIQDQIERDISTKARSQVDLKIQKEISPPIGCRTANEDGLIAAQTWVQVCNQIYSRVFGRILGQIESTVNLMLHPRVFDALPEAAKDGKSNYRYGQFWAGWCAYVSFLRDVMGWDDPVLERFKIEEDLCSCGWVWWHENVLVISDRPRVLKRNQRGQLHCETGPAVLYPDGWGVWALNGVTMERELVETPAEQIDPKCILAAENVEVRRELLRKIGIERFLQVTPHKVLDRLGDYELLAVDLSAELRDRKYLKMTNPSIGVYHVEGVAQECGTVQQALNWRAHDIKTDWTPAALT
jgi:hypothetical protein